MKLIKEIKTDFGKNVKYYELGAAKTTLNFHSLIAGEVCNNRVYKVTNYRGSITEERFHCFIGSEYKTDLECARYRHRHNGRNLTA